MNCPNTPANNPLGRLNPNLGDILYRNNCGSSDYAALTALARYRTSHALFQAAYVVTNYDTLVEEAFRQAKKPFDLVVYPCDRADFANAVMWWPHGAAEPQFEHASSLHIDLSKTTTIFKMHGTIVREQQGWDNFVVTEDDYVDFLARMDSAVPKMLMKHFRTRGFLFLGYSLRDWNLRVVLKNVSKHLLNRSGRKDAVPSWAIQKSASELECLLWGKRNVSIFDVDLQLFVQKLKEQAD